MRLRLHSWVRWLHVYISMFSLLAVLFFAVTGITLNHPDWTFGSAERVTEAAGQLPAGWTTGGQVDWLLVVEHVRGEHGVRGLVSDRFADEHEGWLTFKAPGYSADFSFDTHTGAYEVTTAEQGALAVLNDLHRGRDAGRAWAWLVDLSGAFLALLALTGLGILFYLKRVRASAFMAAAAGGALLIVLTVLVT